MIVAGSVTDWVEAHVDDQSGYKVVGRTAEDFLKIDDGKGNTGTVAVIGAKPMVEAADVAPVLAMATKPDFIINVPSSSIWTGDAIALAQGVPAGFGTFGDLGKAVRKGDLTGYRNKEFAFFEDAIGQHTNVRQVSRPYESAFVAHRRRGDDLTIALIDAYNLSAEDVRNARKKIGAFDIALKMSSYGKVTDAARNAAESIGAEAMIFGDLMRRLAK